MKCLKKIVMLGVLAFLLPLGYVNAATTTVNSQSDLKSALQNSDIDNIILGQDIETTEKINITRPVTIDGNNHTMKYVGTFGSSQSSSNTVWGGIYLLQVYKTNATIRNIKLTGGNAALLVNGGSVKLEGTIDVSGNGFGGIELGQGAGVETVNHIIMDENTNIVNTTETADKPTLWVPSDSDDAILEKSGKVYTIASGAELKDEVLNAILEEQVNPQTGDSILISTLFGLISLGTCGISAKKYFA